MKTKTSNSTMKAIKKIVDACEKIANLIIKIFLILNNL